MSPKATLSKSFESGLLFSVIGNDRMLLQVCSDFDVAKRELDAAFGRSRALLGPFDEADINTESARQWYLTSEKLSNKAFEKFFRQFKNPDEVVKKPNLERLVLVPIMLDQPFVPNDLGDR